MLSDRSLKMLYTKFNREYWNGELPEDTDVMFAPVSSDALAEVTRDEHGDFCIRISPSIMALGYVVNLKLIHEMTHVALWNNKERKLHGPTFKKELLRVLNLGAVLYV